MSLIGEVVELPEAAVAHLEFEQHAARDPDRLALTCGAEQLTYGELNARANQLARHLRSLGVGKSSLVGICQDRSAGLMVSILAVLKAGAAYVPLDPAYPAARLHLMIEQLSGMAAVLGSESTSELLAVSGVPVLFPDRLATALSTCPPDNLNVSIDPQDLCYVVFTSGSTGTPKATGIRHRGWYNLLNWLTLEYGLDDASSNLMLSPFGFDISQRSLMAPLFCGAPLHLLPSRAFDGELAYRLVGELGIRTLHCAPSTLYLLVERELDQGGDALAQVGFVFIGGEPMSAARVAEWAAQQGNRCALLHQYGVAECTDVASSHHMRHFPDYAHGVVPAGKPVYNTVVHLLDENQTEVRAGEVGEICISGASVGAGYLNAEATDIARFATVLIDGSPVPVYRSGDRGYSTPTGELVVVGRIDAQVKIRGMRMDLGEIEHVVRRVAFIRDAVVLAMRPGGGAGSELELVAFVVGKHGTLDFRQLRAHLLEVLPRNMVPQQFIQLPKLPLNPNGKVDRSALLRSSSWP